MSTREQIKDILKRALTNYLWCLCLVSILTSAYAAIITGVLLGFLIDVFWIWIAVEITYWAIAKMYGFARKKL